MPQQVNSLDEITVSELPGGWEGHGCWFNGPVVVADYESHWRHHPRYGQFGSMSIYDSLDAAKEKITKKFGEFTTLLAIPILVVRINLPNTN